MEKDQYISFANNRGVQFLLDRNTAQCGKQQQNQGTTQTERTDLNGQHTA